MGAYNWILVDGDCPACSSRARIRCQTHIASDYGGVGGRFFDREYTIGQEMAWWPRDHARWPNWRQCTARLTDDPEQDEEDCYSNCTSCEASLVVHIRFHLNRPIAVLSIGIDEEALGWPTELDVWVRDMRELLAELATRDFGYEIDQQEVGAPVRSIPEGVPEGLRDMYRAFDGLSLPDVHNGYFIDPAARAEARDQYDPTRISSDPERRIYAFGYDGGGGRFALRLDDGAILHLPEEAAIEDGMYLESDKVRARCVASGVMEFLGLLKRDVQAFLEREDGHPYMTNWWQDRLSDDFRVAISHALDQGLALGDVFPILRRFRDRGLSANDASQVLLGMLPDPDEARDDLIREIGDIVAGWCHPSLRVWPGDGPVE